MRYMLLMNSNEIQEASMSPEDIGQMMAGYGVFTEELKKADAYRDSARLQPTNTATM